MTHRNRLPPQYGPVCLVVWEGPVRTRSRPDSAFWWSGYGEAVADKARAREGLKRLVDDANWVYGGTESWKAEQKVYRCWLYGDGQQRLDDEGKVTQRGFPAEDSEAVIGREEGALAWRVLVKARIRYFSDGVALGSKAYVEEVFRQRREKFGVKRIDGARKMRDVDWGGLMNLRDLRDLRGEA